MWLVVLIRILTWFVVKNTAFYKLRAAARLPHRLHTFTWVRRMIMLVTVSSQLQLPDSLLLITVARLPHGRSSVLLCMKGLSRSHKISHSVPTADKLQANKDRSHTVLLSHALWLVTSPKQRTPIHDRSLKWLKVTVSVQKRSHIFQEASYSKKSTWNKTLTYLKAIFPVNSVNSQLVVKLY